MIIMIGGALILVNMTAGRSYFSSLCSHNIEQAEKRISEWQNGRQIRGKNDWRQFSVSWSDVNCIAVISVVDGPHAACIDHPIDQLALPQKVRLCTTLTSRVMQELVERGGGARDLISLCRLFVGAGKVSEATARRLVRERHNSLLHETLANVPQVPTSIGRAIINGNDVSAFDEFKFKLLAGRQQNSQHAEVFSDLCWADIFPAAGFITLCAAEMENHPRGQIRSSIFGTTTKFRVVVSTNMEALIKLMARLIEQADEEGCSFLYLVSLTSFGVVDMFSISDPPMVWATETELDQRYIAA